MLRVTVAALAVSAMAACGNVPNYVMEGPHGWLAAAVGDKSQQQQAQAQGQPSGQAQPTDQGQAAAEPEAPAETTSVKVATQYLGSVAADDPQAVDIGRQMLASRGSAADAAAAMGLALTVTLPSRAGLDGGGVCLVREVGQSTVQEIDFLPPPVIGAAVQVPGLVRGLAVLQAHDGVLRWQEAVGRAEKLAQSGIAVTQPLYADLGAIGMNGGLKIGDVLPQRSVAATLARLRVAGSADPYTGELAERLIEAGAPRQSLAQWTPSWRPATLAGSGAAAVYVPDGPGGRVAAQAWAALAQARPNDPAQAFAAAHGAVHVDAGRADATTSFVVSDANGQAIGCAIGMGGLFGTGKLIPGMDVYASAPIDPKGMAPLIAVSGDGLRAVVASSGSAAAPLDGAAAAWLVLEQSRPVTTALADPREATDTIGTRIADRLNAISCPAGSPRAAAECVAAFDPRGGGFALTADRF